VKCAVEMGTGGMRHISSSMPFGSGIEVILRKLITSPF
jgi:hypothetical protein